MGKTASADRVVTNSGEITGDSIRGWQDRVVAADGLELAETSFGNIVSDRGHTEDLNQFCKLEGDRKENTAHGVEEIHQLD